MPSTFPGTRVPDPIRVIIRSAIWKWTVIDKKTHMDYGPSLRATALFKGQSLRLVCQPEPSPLQVGKRNSDKI